MTTTTTTIPTFTIALTGQPGAGKDTIGALLGMRGYDRFAFATAIRDEAARYLEVDPALRDSAYPEFTYILSQHATLTTRNRIKSLVPSDVDRTPKPPGMRELLQLWGTEYRRGQDPEYWIERWKHKVYVAQQTTQASAKTGLSLPLAIVVTDLRFPNELTAIESVSTTVSVWSVVNQNNPPSTKVLVHSSEKHQIPADFVINNSGSIWKLSTRVKQVLWEMEAE